jgi:penicillin-binding protein 1A
VKGAGIDDKNEVKTKRVIPEGVASQATQILQTVVSSGTGKNAAIGGFAAGKTGTTENFQDAWFVGFNETMTVAVWLGYPKGGRAMETEYHGEPVAGGTYPAELWRDFMLRVKEIREARAQKHSPEAVTGPTGPAPVAPAPSTETEPQQSEQSKPKRNRQNRKAPKPPAATPEPEPTQPPDTSPQPTPGEPPPESPAPPSGGAGGASGGAEQ